MVKSTKDLLQFAMIIGVAGVAATMFGCGSSSKAKPRDGGADASTDRPIDRPTDGKPSADAAKEIGGEVAADASGEAGPIDAPSEEAVTDAGSDGDATAADAPVEALAPTPAPDFIWYVLDETSGTTAKDSSSHHYDITNLTGVTWNQGANFDGQNGGGSTTVGPSYRMAPITLSAWLKPVARTDGNTTRYSLQPFPPNALSDDVPGVGGYGIGLNVWSDTPSGSALEAEGVAPCTQAGLCVANTTQNAIDGGAYSCTSANSCNQGFSAGVEYLVTLTIAAPADGGTTPTAQIYVNGELFDQANADIIAPNANPPLYLGRHNDDTGYGTTRVFDGRIRDVRVYQRQLPADEVKQLYLNGPTTKAPPTDGGAADGSSQ